MEELKPCPFCGSEPTIRIFKGKDGWRDRYAVICRYDEGGCGAESGLYHYESEAIGAWNRRTESQWIPCTEQLPEEDEQVFVYLFDASPHIAWVCDSRWHTEEFVLDEDEEPAAWMPLPEPYKERREE